jgi:hypothetical protein
MLVAASTATARVVHRIVLRIVCLLLLTSATTSIPVRRGDEGSVNAASCGCLKHTPAFAFGPT